MKVRRTLAVAVSVVLVSAGQAMAPAAAAPTTYSIDDVAVVEGDSGLSNAIFTVTRTGTGNGRGSVSFSSSAGTATPAEDYEETSGTATFERGETAQVVAIAVLGDTAREADETLFVTLSDARGGRLGDGVAVGTILNDDLVADLVSTIDVRPTAYRKQCEDDNTRTCPVGKDEPHEGGRSNALAFGVKATLTNLGPDPVADTEFAVFNEASRNSNLDWLVSGTFTGTDSCGQVGDQPHWIVRCTGVELPVGAHIQIEVHVESLDVYIGTKGFDSLVPDPDVGNNIVYEPDADLEATVTLVQLSATEFSFTAVATNLGPTTLTDVWLRFAITQSEGVIDADPVTVSGTYTGGNCGPLVGNMFVAGTWGGDCTEVSLAPGAYIQVDVPYVAYSSPPSLTVRMEAFDDVIVDLNPGNNIRTDSFFP